MTSEAEDFIYTFHEEKTFNPTTSRKVHILRLNDLLRLFIERGDLQRARHAWAILMRCKEFDWSKKWRTALLLMSDPKSTHQYEDQGKVDFLKKLMRRYPDEQEAILQEIVLQLADSGNFHDALEELESYLPSFPYQDNPLLHCYAGLLSLQLAVQDAELNMAQKSTRLKSAQSHFQRTLNIDPGNLVAGSFIAKASELLKNVDTTTLQTVINEPSEDEMDVDGTNPRSRTKRARRKAEAKE